jgi:hypothetical protein
MPVCSVITHSRIVGFFNQIPQRLIDKGVVVSNNDPSSHVLTNVRLR